MYTTYGILVIPTLIFIYVHCQQYNEAVFLSDDVTYGCGGYVDLVLVVDASAFTRFNTPRGIQIWHPGIGVFVNNLLRVLQVGPASFRVAAILYSTSIDDIMPFTVHQVYSIHTFGFLRPGFGISNTAKGLAEMRKMLTFYGRQGAAKRAILLSASHSNDHQMAIAEANIARSMGIDILSVGFGPFRDIGELNEISPGWVLEVPDAGMLHALVGKIAARLCKESINGGWSPWLSWTPCSKSCDGGVSRRYRFCNNPLPQYGGSFCTGAPDIRKECNMQPCLSFFSSGVDWSTWGPCSVTCGTGTRSRSRPCLSRSQCRPGASETETLTCRMSACPVESTWGSWFSWEPCSVTCGRGVRQRRRKCLDVSPGIEGRCLGPGIDTDTCNTGITCQECEKCIPGPGGQQYAGCPHDCTRYIQCPPPGYEALVKICSHGLLWSNRQQKCVQPSDSECDLCAGKLTDSEVWYSCREYWICGRDHKHPQLQCCPSGFHFVNSLGCMKDFDGSCKTECFSRPSLDFQAKNCSYRPSPLGSYWYEEITSDTRKTHACPAGTKFSQEVCQCVMAHELSHGVAFSRGCHTMVNMAFQSRDQDTKNTVSKVQYKNVVYINNESAMFGKDSSISYLYFSNADMGRMLFLHMRILPELAEPPQAILHNGGCDTFSKPTLLVGIDKANSDSELVYIFGITIEEIDKMVFLNLTTKRSSELSDLVLRFDGSSLEVEVNGKTAQMDLNKIGNIARSRGALQLGGEACSIGYSAFSGLVNLIEVTTCSRE
ncbi:uncharacterized protein [Argopecten irradians]|uniref:uncharacterized protein n=1 Tax=Argopecten irradians TaxID=31199 RepID=UPI00371C66BB